jgi:hypothetical protein
MKEKMKKDSSEGNRRLPAMHRFYTIFTRLASQFPSVVINNYCVFVVQTSAD